MRVLMLTGPDAMFGGHAVQRDRTAAALRGHRPGDPVPKVWQHDLYHGDFTPYDKNEIETLKKYIGNANSGSSPTKK